MLFQELQIKIQYISEKVLMNLMNKKYQLMVYQYKDTKMKKLHLMEQDLFLI